jgi:hypothetical protein
VSQLVSVGSLKEFFRTLIIDATKRRNVSLEEVTEFYVVNLLSDYAESEKLFTQESEGKKQSEPLALIYHRALQQERDEKIRTLRRLGDQSLYTAGFFQESLKGTLVGPGYYMEMGKTAYGAVAELSGTSSFAHVYTELKTKFHLLVEVLEEIAARGLCASGPQGQMQIFESWSRSGSEHLESVLVDSGMLPAKKLVSN